MVREAFPDYRERSFYLSGPPDMVKAYERVLRHMGVSGRQIKRDFFPGLVWRRWLAVASSCDSPKAWPSWVLLVKSCHDPALTRRGGRRASIGL
jgi:ferredoxin-NADP reductase